VSLAFGIFYSERISVSSRTVTFQNVCNVVRQLMALTVAQCYSTQGDHLSGKPGNVMEFDSCQGNVRDFTKNQGIVREKILSRKGCLKLFIINCITVSVQVFSRSLLCLIVKYMVLDHALLHSYPTTDSNTSTGMI